MILSDGKPLKKRWPEHASEVKTMHLTILAENLVTGWESLKNEGKKIVYFREKTDFDHRSPGLSLTPPRDFQKRKLNKKDRARKKEIFPITAHHLCAFLL